MSRPAQHQLFLILLIVLLGFIGNSISYPIFAPLFLHPVDGGIIPSSWGIKERSLFLGITLMMYPIGQFLGSPILGALSDQYGRRKILVSSLVILTFLYFLTALSLSLNLLWMLIVSRLLSGCCEGNISLARSIVVDIPELNKHRSLGLISAMSALGYVLGPLLGGILTESKWVKWFNYSTPFYTSALLSLLLTIFTIIYLQESLKQGYKSDINIMQQFYIIKRLQRLCQNRNIRMLFITSTLASLSYDTFYEFYPAYMAGLWQSSTIEIAWYTAALSAAIGIGCGWLSPYLSHYFSLSKAIIISTPIIVAIFICLLFSPTKLLVLFLFIMVGFAIAMTTTNYTVQVSEAANAKIQGEVLGSLWGLRMLLDGLISIIGSGLIIFSYSLPIAVAALSAFVSWMIYYYYFIL